VVGFVAVAVVGFVAGAETDASPAAGSKAEVKVNLDARMEQAPPVS